MLNFRKRLTDAARPLSRFVVGLALPMAYELVSPSSMLAETLSYNLNAATNYTEVVSGSQWVGANFQTGNSTYTLTDITLLLQGDNGSTSTLALYSDSDAVPDKKLGILTSPTAFSSTLTPTSFGGRGLQLAPKTSYWAVLQPDSGTSEWAYTADNSGSGVGFQPNWAISYAAGSGWYASDDGPMQMQVDADPSSTATPEPGSFLLLLCGTTALIGFSFLRHRTARTGTA